MSFKAEDLQHPLFQDSAIFPTQPLEDFINTLKLWIDNLLPGGIVYGNQRIGKTQAIKYLINNSSECLGNEIPITLISAWEPTLSSTTENRFFSELLYAIGYALPNSGTAGVKRRRAIDFLIEKVLERREHRYLMIIDEAQWLSKNQLRYLMDIHNQLKIANIRLITILVGQPELLTLKQELRTSRERHLVGRFMTGSHEFHGMRNIDDLKRVMSALDSNSEYPIGSGCSCTEYFAPKAFSKGWRLEQHAEQTWKLLNEILNREKISRSSKVDLPMQPFTAFFIWLMRTIREMDSDELELHENIIEKGLYQVSIQFRDLG
jgi:AAA domain-containing protein